jgi:hypothetical protein
MVTQRFGVVITSVCWKIRNYVNLLGILFFPSISLKEGVSGHRILHLASYRSCVISDTARHVRRYFVGCTAYAASNKIVLNAELEGG